MSAMVGTYGYQRVHDDADIQNSQAEKLIDGETMSKTRRLNWLSMFIGVVVGIALSFIVFMITSIGSKDTCTRKTSVWSPALGVYKDNELSVQRWNGALRDSNKFRGPPSQEIDDAWKEITYPEGGLVRLSKDQLIKINASEYAAEYTEEMGGGYIAGIEALHQLHCVNMLRQATYMDYYLPKNEEWKDRKTLRYHLDHCIDMLRQKIMCDADTGMITYVWAKGWKQAFPDFNTVHKCRDYSQLLDWAKENYVHGRNVADIERVPGALERDTRP